MLIPEHISKEVVKGKKYLEKDEEYEAIVYFHKILPQILKNELKDVPVIQFVQKPGLIIDAILVSNMIRHRRDSVRSK